MTFDLDEIRSFANRKTPFYVYDLDSLKQDALRVRDLADGYTDILYFEPANRNRMILNLLQAAGLGVTVVRPRGIARVLDCGFDEKLVQISGYGMARKDLLDIERYGIQANLATMPEIRNALEMFSKARIGIRLDNDTGELDKRGISMEQAIAVINSNADRIGGVHSYIGTNISDAGLHAKLAERLASIVDHLPEPNRKSVFRINCGGGFSYDYVNQKTFDWQKYFQRIGELRSAMKLPAHVRFQVEAGRSLVAHCGRFITRVIYNFEKLNTRFAVLDANMSQFPRPVRYGFDKDHFPFMTDGQHKLRIVNPIHRKVLRLKNGSKAKGFIPLGIVGNSHYSKDWFAKCLIDENDISYLEGGIAVFEGAGAYSEAMSEEWADEPLERSLYIQNGKLKTADAAAPSNAIDLG